MAGSIWQSATLTNWVIIPDLGQSGPIWVNSNTDLIVFNYHRFKGPKGNDLQCNDYETAYSHLQMQLTLITATSAGQIYTTLDSEH